MKRSPLQEHIFPLALLAAIVLHLLLLWGLPASFQPPTPVAKRPLRVGLRRLPPPPAAPGKTAKPADNQVVNSKPAPASRPETGPKEQPTAKPLAPKPHSASAKVATPTPAEPATSPTEKTEAIRKPEPTETADLRVSALPGGDAPKEKAPPFQPAAAEAAESLPRDQAGPPETAIWETTSPPSLLHQPDPYYPPLARRMGWQGKVLLRLIVEANGRVGQVEIDESSGYPLLDRSARKQVRTWRFEPARKNGIPVRGEVLLPVVFKLRRD